MCRLRFRWVRGRALGEEAVEGFRERCGRACGAAAATVVVSQAFGGWHFHDRSHRPVNCFDDVCRCLQPPKNLSSRHPMPLASQHLARLSSRLTIQALRCFQKHSGCDISEVSTAAPPPAVRVAVKVRWGETFRRLLRSIPHREGLSLRIEGIIISFGCCCGGGGVVAMKMSKTRIAVATIWSRELFANHLMLFLGTCSVESNLLLFARLFIVITFSSSLSLTMKMLQIGKLLRA